MIDMLDSSDSGARSFPNVLATTPGNRATSIRNSLLSTGRNASNNSTSTRSAPRPAEGCRLDGPLEEVAQLRQPRHGLGENALPQILLGDNGVSEPVAP